MAFSPRSNKERKNRFSIDPELSAISMVSPTRALSVRQRSRAPPIPAREVRKAQRAASLSRGSLLSGNPLIQAGLSNRVVSELLALNKARTTQARARERAGERAERLAPTFTEEQLEKAAEREARATWQKKIDDLTQSLTDAWDEYLSRHYEQTGVELKDKDPDFLKMAQREVGPFFFNRRTKKAVFKPTSPMSAQDIFSKGVIYKGKGRSRGKAKKPRRRFSDSDMPVVGLKSRPTPLMLQRQNEERMAQQNYLSKMKGMKGKYKSELDELSEKVGGRRRRKTESESESEEEELCGGGYNEDVFDLRGLADGSMKYSQLSDSLKNSIRDIEVTPATFYPFPSYTIEEIYLDLGPDNDKKLARYLKANPFIVDRLIKTWKKQNPQPLNPNAVEYNAEDKSHSFIPDFYYTDRSDTEFWNLPRRVMSAMNMYESEYQPLVDNKEDNRTVDSFFAGRGRCMPRFHSREYHGRGRLGFDNPLPGSTRGW